MSSSQGRLVLDAGGLRTWERTRGSRLPIDAPITDGWTLQTWHDGAFAFLVAGDEVFRVKL